VGVGRLLLQNGFNARDLSGGMLSRLHTLLLANDPGSVLPESDRRVKLPVAAQQPA
jgi:hypothetical protein